MASTRFILDVCGALGVQLNEIASHEGTTTETLLRKALFLYMTAISAKRQADQVVVFYDPATLQIEIEVINL